MRVMVYDDKWRFLLVGDAMKAKPEEKERVLVEFLEACERKDLIEILRGENKSFLFGDTVYLPYSKQEILEDLGLEEFQRLYGKEKPLKGRIVSKSKSTKRRPQK
jgi:hypothetical protein